MEEAVFDTVEESDEEEVITVIDIKEDDELTPEIDGKYICFSFMIIMWNIMFLVSKLIEAVRSREALWDWKCAGYKNRTIKFKLWKEVAREISKCF